VRDVLIEDASAGRALSCFVVDSHCHLGECPFTVIDPSVEALLRAMDRCGIDAAVVSSTPGCLAGRIPEGNDEVIEAVKRHGDRIFGLISIDPYRPQKSLDELKRCRDAGLRAIKVHDHVGVKYDDAAYEFAWRFANEHGWPILAHTWGSETLERLKGHFKTYPSVKWILAHAGSADRNAYADVAKEYDNVHLELAFSRSPRRLVEYFVEAGLADRVLHGSDAVFMDAAAQLGRVVFAEIALADKMKILGENARRVWGL